MVSQDVVVASHTPGPRNTNENPCVNWALIAGSLHAVQGRMLHMAISGFPAVVLGLSNSTSMPRVDVVRQVSSH